jgi:hypothetical protein
MAKTLAAQTDAFVAALNTKFDTDTFTASAGKRFDKVIKELSNGQRTVYSFVERETGDLYKAAGWSAPAKGIRYPGAVLLTQAVEAADPYGSFLYIR